MTLGSRLAQRAIRPGALIALAGMAALVMAQPPYVDRPLAEVLEEFRANGLALVYSSDLVTGELRVFAEPNGATPLEIVREILAGHKLAMTFEGGVYLVTRAPPSPGFGMVQVSVGRMSASPGSHISVRLVGPQTRSAQLAGGSVEFRDLPVGEYSVVAEALLHAPARDTVVVRPNSTSSVTLQLAPAVPRLEEVTVSASRYDITGDGQYATAYFSRAEIENLSDLGGDPLRVVHRLPGVASGGFSAKSHMRGGNTDEMVIVLDGLELIDPFHIRDFQSLFSSINQRAVSSIQVYSGGFPANYGDSLSGLMLIESRVADEEALHEIGVSLFSTSLLSSGRFGDGKADWIATVRRGNLDLLLHRKFGKPSYGDAFAHVGFELNPKVYLSVNGLASKDDISVIAEDEGVSQENAQSDTSNQQFWFKLENRWSDAMSSETVASSAHFSNIRSGVLTDPREIDARVRDRRVLDVSAIKQDWQYDLSDMHLLKWGFDAKRLKASYDYASYSALLGFFAAFRGANPLVRRDIDIRPSGESYAAYFSDRLSIGDRFVAELGVRWDKQTYLPESTGDDQFSPRLSALFRLGTRTDLRASWGRFYQSQDMLALQVEDGQQDFFPAQLAEHSIVSIEHLFRKDIAVRVEAYRKRMPQLHSRFENLFEVFGLLPELRPDRTQIDSGSGTAQGVEVLVSKDAAQALSWWASYSRSKVEDAIGGRDVPRSWDQRHTVSGGLTWRGAHWTVTPAFSYHTGWPTTELTLNELAGGNGPFGYEVVPGPRNAQRLGDFERLDLRAARLFDTRRGSLEAYIEVTNLADRDNPCCVDYELELTNDGTRFIEQSIGNWMPRVISAGFLWEF
jgi:outer membrane receptor protein involved in Fe transport